MNNQEEIIVLKTANRFKYKEKGSLFVGITKNVSSVNEANNLLEKIRKEFYDATHHCYAYKISEGTEKYSDDGEPNGTAGIRILNAINHFNLTNILLVVVRYFGGTKLGTGPLGKAYANTALSVLKEAEFVILKKYFKLKVFYDYEASNKIHHLLNKYACKEIKTGFEKLPVVTFYIEQRLKDKFSFELTEATKGKAELKTIENSIYKNFKT